MKPDAKLLMTAVVGAVCLIGCSQEDRDEIGERVGNAKRALSGETSSEERTPRIVKEQQRKERIRQNNTWTPENRALHPIEYCQAQLEELDKYARQLEATAHEKSCASIAAKRELGDVDVQERQLEKFVSEAKAVYKKCEAEQSWPAKLGGYELSKEKTQQKIIDAVQKLADIRQRTGTKRNMLNSLDKALKITRDEQKRVVQLRERVQNTLSDLKLKKVIDGDEGIKNSLNAISDAMGALGVDYDDPKIESIIQPDEKSTREELFKTIMAE